MRSQRRRDARGAEVFEGPCTHDLSLLFRRVPVPCRHSTFSVRISKPALRSPTTRWRSSRIRFVPTRLAAGEFLQRAGEVTRHAAFVASGCLRSYVIDANGKEHIIQFAPETWWLADAPA